MLPVIHVHHHLEDDIIFPFYLTLGMIAPQRQTEDHITLVNRMNTIKYLAANLKAAIKNDDDEFKDKLTALLDAFLQLRKNLFEHIAEEEVYWPQELKKYGASNWSKVEELVITDTLSHGDANAGDPHRLTLCAIARASGANY